jgi:hypothetical protein
MENSRSHTNILDSQTIDSDSDTTSTDDSKEYSDIRDIFMSSQSGQVSNLTDMENLADTITRTIKQPELNEDTTLLLVKLMDIYKKKYEETYIKMKKYKNEKEILKKIVDKKMKDVKYYKNKSIKYKISAIENKNLAEKYRDHVKHTNSQ